MTDAAIKRERHNVAVRAWAARNPEKVLAKSNAWAAANREKRRAQNRAWYARNLEAQRERVRKAYEANRESMQEYHREWSQANPDKTAEHNSRRRALEAGAPVVERIVRSEIIRRDRSRCHICGELVGLRDVHLDHIVPLSRGGEHTAANLAVAHSQCNLRKWANPVAA